jgi:signal transduction histidine kinase
MQSTKRHRIARISIYYIAAAFVWIVGTDWLLANAATDLDQMATLQTYKGLVFIMLSGMAIFVILQHQERLHRDEVGQLHIARAQLEARLAERTGELESSRRQLSEIEQLSNRLMGDLAHSLRTPLTSLNIRIEMIRRVPVEQRDSYLDGIREQVLYLNRLVADMLDLSLIERVDGQLQLIPLDLNEQVALAVAIHGPQAEQNGLELVFEPGSDLPPVLAESISLVRIVDNLVANGVKYTPAGRVEIRTDFDSARHMVRLVVQDTGIGIPPEDITHLFDRFFRGRSARKVGSPGAGLGLGIVRHTLDILKGDIDVQSEVGYGTTFTVWLPPAAVSV